MATYNGGTVTAHIGADIADYQSAMKTVSSVTSSAMATANQAVADVGKTLAVTGAAVTALGVKALTSFGSFEQSLNQAAVIAGGTSKDIQGLADVANKMGADLPLSAKDAADAMVAMARDGASISTIKEEFPAIAQAATAAGSDLQQTASVVQNAMNIWGESIGSPAQAASTLVQVANLSNASIEEMQHALATAGGSARLAGMSMQDTSSAIGLLTNQGFSAADASQDLNHAILQMLAPSQAAQGAMSDLGLSFTDANGNLKPFKQILQETAKATDGMGAADKAAALKTIFHSAGMKAMIPLLKAVEDETGNTTTSWDAFTKAVDDASSSQAQAEKVLESQSTEMQKNVGSKLEQVGGNWDSLSNKSQEAAKAINGAWIDMTNNALQWATTSNSAIAKGIRGFLGLAPIIGAATLATGSFLTAATKIGSVMSTVGTAIVSPLGIAVIGILAVVAAFSYAYNTSEQFRKTIQNLASSFMTALAPAFEFIKNTVMSFVDTTVSGFKNFADNAINSFSKVTSGLNFSQLADTVIVVFSALMDIVISFGNIVTEVISVISNTSSIQSSWVSVSGVLSTVQAIISVARDAVVGLIEGFLSTGAIQSAWNAIIAVVKAVISIAEGLWSIITGLINSFGGISSISDTFNQMGQYIGGVVVVISNIITAIADFINAAMKIQAVKRYYTVNCSSCWNRCGCF